MFHDSFQPSTVDLLFANELCFEAQPIAKEGSWSKFLHEASAQEPLVRSGRLFKEPRCQPSLPMGGYGSVEQMEKRMGAHQV